ncbi:hypothetical protein [Cohnella zeiphila]|uniref:Acid shock protein n=1 Tax=Cohnella zeiphila TaxID=2761120 RepID=A0A7X0VUW9_9BACL|nr:hypothetical protein [Cohnella zeiphila]MBB6729323.1 hypothetical protein [Cohnella zeiphila]
MKKLAIAVLTGCLFMSTAAVASAAPAEHHKTHKMHAKSTAKHKLHAKSMHKHKHKLKAKSKSNAKILGGSKIRAKSITPKALPKTGYGGTSE